MATNRMKLDFNNLIRQIDEVLGAENIEEIRNNAFGIGIGLEMLCGYMKTLAQYAIDRNDEFLLEWCKDLLIVKEKSDE